jgi:TIR domain
MATEPTRPLSIYLSYAQKDETLKQEFATYLAILQQAKLLTGWVERQVQPGIDWSHIIDPRLLTVDLIVFLMSPDLLSSGYCSGAEVQKALERYQSEHIPLFLIILRRVDLTGFSLAQLLPLPRNRKPIMSWPDRDEAWWDIDQEIRRTISVRH